MQKQTYTESRSDALMPLFTPLSAFDRTAKRLVVTGERPLTNLSESRRIHFHDFMEIGYCVSGSALYYIRDEIYPVGQGDIVIVYPGEVHDGCIIRAGSSIWRFLFVNVSVLFADLPDREHLIQLTDRTKYRGRLCGSAEKKRILPLLQRIFDLFDEQEALAREHPYPALLTAAILYDPMAGGGLQLNVMRLTVMAIGAMLMILGNFMPKARRNSFYGLRTGWSLSSDEVWQKSQRFAGHTSVLCGVIMVLLAAFLDGFHCLIMSTVLVLLWMIASVVMSYRYYRESKK